MKAGCDSSAETGGPTAEVEVRKRHNSMAVSAAGFLSLMPQLTAKQDKHTLHTPSAGVLNGSAVAVAGQVRSAPAQGIPTEAVRARLMTA